MLGFWGVGRSGPTIVLRTVVMARAPGTAGARLPGLSCTIDRLDLIAVHVWRGRLITRHDHGRAREPIEAAPNFDNGLSIWILGREFNFLDENISSGFVVGNE